MMTDTHCPTCGSVCRIAGDGTTHSYEPVARDLPELWRRYRATPRKGGLLASYAWEERELLAQEIDALMERLEAAR
jgi:hypothetical protein